MKIMMIASAAAAMAVLFAGAADAQRATQGHHGPSAERGQGMRALMMLGAADYDGNNTVTRAEVERLQGEEFAFRDRNGDGFLDQADASPIRQRLAQQRGDAAQSRRGPRGRGSGAVARLDEDEDSRISRAEFMNRELVLFGRLDADADGAVTAEEIDAALASRRENHRARREARQWWRD